MHMPIQQQHWHYLENTSDVRCDKGREFVTASSPSSRFMLVTVLYCCYTSPYHDVRVRQVPKNIDFSLEALDVLLGPLLGCPMGRNEDLPFRKGKDSKREESCGASSLRPCPWLKPPRRSPARPPSLLSWLLVRGASWK